MKSLIFLITVYFSLNVYAIEIKKCGKLETEVLQKSHREAYEQTQKALNLLQNLNDPLVMKSFKIFFKLETQNPHDSKKIKRVLRVVKKYIKKAEKTVYKCGYDQGWCTTNPLAIVPPPKRRVYLCAPYFRRNPIKQTATLVHEWGHRWGGIRMAYAFEKYCYEWDQFKSRQLVRQPDAYMLFISYLATNGVGIDCFKK
jgi:hypothetical protein